MAPRRYNQRRRADAAAATREAIVDAAIDIYREDGVAGATMKAIAARADVSRGTILHHFGDADGLLEAALDRILASLELPDERIFHGHEEPEARVRAYSAAMVAFFRRSAPWWPVFESRMQMPGVEKREADYWAAIGRLQSGALGEDLARDPVMQTAISAVMHPQTLGSLLWQLESGGISLDAAARIVEDFVVGFMSRRTTVGREEETS